MDGKGKFGRDEWTREAGGGGLTRVIEDGNVVEKGGVNFSAVHGAMPANISAALGIGECNFYATGVSLVLHPSNPMVPIIHMNVRYFETDQNLYWFGGGIDLTPHYIMEEDARFFHESLKGVCDAHDPLYYPRFKEWADDYFYLKHRDETRGIGGIFFDRLMEDEDHSKPQIFDFVKGVGDAFAPTYVELANRHRDDAYTEEEKDWQLYRRGRYVEFNLILDKGTKFGIDTNGRTESIFISLPPLVKWEYQRQIPTGSPEGRTQSLLKKGIDWV